MLGRKIALLDAGAKPYPEPIAAEAHMEDLSFTYFPDNYRWSHGLLIGLNMAPWGGAEIGEVNRCLLYTSPSPRD